MLEETYLLANGVKIPKIGFGTWMIADNAAAATAVHEAIDAGYRHIDTAEAYGNEVGVGEGVRAAGIARQDRKSTRLNSSHSRASRMPSSA